MIITRGAYEFDDDPARVDADAVWDFLSTQAYWGKFRTRADFEAQLAAAWRVVGVYETATGRQAGFARAISDGVSFAHLADVFIVPDARGAGLGKELVATMIDRGPGAGFGWALHTADAHGLYQQYGFAGPDASYLERPPRDGTTAGTDDAAAAEPVLTRERLAAFTRAARIGVVATTSADGHPEAALVELAATDTGELIFDSAADARKVANIAGCRRVAVVVGWDSGVTVQVEGDADILAGSLRASYGEVYLAQFPRSRALHDDFALVRVIPRWLRYYDARPGPHQVITATWELVTVDLWAPIIYSLVLAESREIASGGPADLGARDREDLGGMHSAHHLPAAYGDARREQQPVEVDALIAQRVALVHADDGRREPLDVPSCRE